MSQLPFDSGSQPPGLEYVSSRAPLRHARRASVLMWVLGTLFVVFGFITAVVGGTITPEKLAATPGAEQTAAQAAELERTTGVTLATFYLIMGLVLLGVGGVIGGIAFFVRRGRLASLVTAAVLCGGIGLIALLFCLGALVQSATAGPIALVAALIFILPPTAALVVLEVWLIQAMRAASTGAGGAYPGAGVRPTGHSTVPGANLTPGTGVPTGVPIPREFTTPAPSGGGQAGTATPLLQPAQANPWQQVPLPPAGEPPVRFGYAVRPATPPSQPTASASTPNDSSAMEAAASSDPRRDD